MTCILAIDPGSRGALAWVGPDGALLDVADIPSIEVRGRNRVDAAAFADLFYRRAITMVIIEGVGSMPKQGVASSFAFGYAAGLCEGIAAGFGLPVQIIFAAMWKRRAGVSRDKGAARQMAIRYWPKSSGWFSRVKDDGRAEAALFGRWYALTGGEATQQVKRSLPVKRRGAVPVHA